MSESFICAKILPRMDADGRGWKDAFYPCLSACIRGSMASVTAGRAVLNCPHLKAGRTASLGRTIHNHENLHQVTRQLLAAHCRAALQVSCNPGFFAQYPPFCGKSAQVPFHERLATKIECCQSRLIKGCASEVDRNAGASPARRVRLFTTEHDLNSVAARRGWKLRKMSRRAVTKMNHIQ